MLPFLWWVYIFKLNWPSSLLSTISKVIRMLLRFSTLLHSENRNKKKKNQTFAFSFTILSLFLNFFFFLLKSLFSSLLFGCNFGFFQTFLLYHPLVWIMPDLFVLCGRWFLGQLLYFCPTAHCLAIPTVPLLDEQEFCFISFSPLPLLLGWNPDRAGTVVNNGF